MPTADDRLGIRTFLTATLENETWYLTPFAALLLTPNDRFFSQDFISYRMAAGADAVTSRRISGNIDYSNRRDSNMLMIDSSVGYWIYRDPRGRGLTGLAPTLELHYMTTTEDGDDVYSFDTRTDYLSLTAGCTAEIARNATLATGLVLPLREQEDLSFGPTNRNFDWELAIQLNIRYGQSRR